MKKLDLNSIAMLKTRRFLPKSSAFGIRKTRKTGLLSTGLLSSEQRRSKDDRTLGEIFYFFTDELAVIAFGESQSNFAALSNSLVASILSLSSRRFTMVNT